METQYQWSKEELATIQRYGYYLQAMNPSELKETWREVFNRDLKYAELTELHNLCLNTLIPEEKPFMTLEEENQYAVPLKIRVIVEPHAWDIGGFPKHLADVLPIVRHIEKQTAETLKRKHISVIMVRDDGKYTVSVPAPDDHHKVTEVIPGLENPYEWYTYE